MDIVYILGTGSVWQDNEIRYSLRSVEAFALDVRNVYVVGERPEWLQNVVHLGYPDSYPAKWKNSFVKICRACLEPTLSNDFLLMNDDFFLNKPQKISDFPYYYTGALLSGDQSAVFKKFLRENQTASLLPSISGRGLRYDTHQPFRLNKQKFLEMPVSLDYNMTISFRSYYGNLYDVGGEIFPEILLSPGMSEGMIKAKLLDARAFSIMSLTGESSIFRDYIRKRFPRPSKYEICP